MTASKNRLMTTDAAENAPVTMTIKDRVAVLTIDNPPVNAGSHAVRAGLIEALRRCGDVDGAIIIGAGRSFIAGSDLREFGKKLEWPELPDVIAQIEAAAFPVVAAIHGVALGGGLELALGCDYRIAANGAKLGLPEVSLGMVPGAGGTQRLPRLVGRTRAIAMICASQRIFAEEALKSGLVDAVAASDLLAEARAFLRDPDARYVTIPDTLCEAGRLGRKSGAGWYDYGDGQGITSPTVTAIVDAVRRQAGIAARSFYKKAIQRQLLIAMVNEAALLLDEGVAQRPGDVDVALANGYGFPRWQGGPLWWGAHQSPDRIEQDLAQLGRDIGHGFRAGPVQSVLSNLRG